MAEEKSFNQQVLEAARGNPTKQQMRAFFGNSQEKKDKQEQQA